MDQEETTGKSRPLRGQVVESKTKTTTGLDQNISAALCWVPFVGWFVALVWFFAETNSFVKYHSVQSLIVTMLLLITVFLVLPLATFGFFGLGFQLLTYILVLLYGAYIAYNNKRWNIPFVSDMTTEWIKE